MSTDYSNLSSQAKDSLIHAYNDYRNKVIPDDQTRVAKFRAVCSEYLGTDKDKASVSELIGRVMDIQREAMTHGPESEKDMHTHSFQVESRLATPVTSEAPDRVMLGQVLAHREAQLDPDHFDKLAEIMNEPDDEDADYVYDEAHFKEVDRIMNEDRTDVVVDEALDDEVAETLPAYDVTGEADSSDDDLPAPPPSRSPTPESGDSDKISLNEPKHQPNPPSPPTSKEITG